MAARYLLLWDIDGTLLHSGGCGRASTQLALKDVFGTTGLLDRVNFAGKTDWQIVREALLPAGVPLAEVDARLGEYAEAVGRRLVEIIGRFAVRPCDGAPEVIAALKQRPDVINGLVTGNMPTLVPTKLRAAGYDPADFVIGAYGSEGWERAMLPPRALERAQALTGVRFAPEHIVVIGDTPGDIACAASIGARTLAVATGPYSLQELQRYRPDHAFATLDDTGRVLDALLRDGPTRHDG